MTETIHPLASHHLPPFITAPGQTDVLFIVVIVIVAAIVLLIGVFYFKLHALPEHIAHGADKVQFEIVAVLALLALFTHNHLFWIAALLLSLVRLPDFTTPLNGMAEALGRIADRRQSRSAVTAPMDTGAALSERAPKPGQDKARQGSDGAEQKMPAN